jgi:hypothetical protein
MIRRILLAAAVLGAAIFWANCKYNPPQVAPDEPNWNTFFAGCFEGEITDPASAGKLKIILVAGQSDEFTLSGCLQASLATGTETATLSGMVQEDRQQAELTGMVNPQKSFVILVERQPAGETAADTVTVSNVRDTSFNSAANLSKCTQTCADLGIPLPFMSGGGPP